MAGKESQSLGDLIKKANDASILLNDLLAQIAKLTGTNVESAPLLKGKSRKPKKAYTKKQPKKEKKVSGKDFVYYPEKFRRYSFPLDKIMIGTIELPHDEFVAKINELHPEIAKNFEFSKVPGEDNLIGVKRIAAKSDEESKPAET